MVQSHQLQSIVCLQSIHSSNTILLRHGDLEALSGGRSVCVTYGPELGLVLSPAVLNINIPLRRRFGLDSSTNLLVSAWLVLILASGPGTSGVESRSVGCGHAGDVEVVDATTGRTASGEIRDMPRQSRVGAAF